MVLSQKCVVQGMPEEADLPLCLYVLDLYLGARTKKSSSESFKCCLTPSPQPSHKSAIFWKYQGRASQQALEIPSIFTA